jgi:xylulokinase
VKPYILGIDIGTSACKCCVIDTSGNIVTTKSSEYSIIAHKNGAAVQDPDIWFQALIRTLADIQKSGDIELNEIIAVGTTGQMRGLNFLGANGKAVAHSILWNDTRCVSEAEQLNKTHHDMLKKITFNPINTMCTLPKILWVMKNEPDIWNKTSQFIYPKDYINYRLTEKIATDHSDASGSSIYDFKNNAWSDEIIKEFKLDKNKFPKILNSFDVLGGLSKKAAEKSGLNVGIPVVVGGSDATVELFSIGVVDDSQCKVRLGSSCGISIVVDETQHGHNMDHYCWKPVTMDGIIRDINTRFCAQSVRWLRDVFYSELPKTGETYQIIDREAKSVESGAQGLIFHPYLQGEDAPYWDTTLTGSFTGINSGHQRKHFARAVFEGVAFSLKDVISTYPNIYANCDTFKIIGGGTKSKTWLSIIIDVLGKDAIIPKNGDAAYGACLIALSSTLLSKTLDITQTIIDKNVQIIKPNKKNHEFYDQQFKKYKKLAHNLTLSQLEKA